MRTRSQSREQRPPPPEGTPVVIEPLRIEYPFQEDPTLEPMADTRTMAQLLQAPTEGYEDAILIPEIVANNFELKHGLINLVQNKQFFGHDKEDPHAHIRYFNKITSTMRVPNVPITTIKLMLFPFSIEGAARIWLEKEPPRSIQTWDDLVSKFINQFFPPSKTTNLRNEITRFQQRFDESFYEAWDRFNDLLRAMSTPMDSQNCINMIHSIMALNINDQDSCELRSSGNFLDKMPRDMDIVRALLLDKKNQLPAPAPLLHLFQSISPKLFYMCPAVDYNQVSSNFRPQMVSNHIRPPGFPPVQNSQANNANNFNRGNNFNQNRESNFNQNRGGNFNQSNFSQNQLHRPQFNQSPAYQAPVPQTHSVTKNDFDNYVKANDAIMRNMQNNLQNQGQSMQIETNKLNNQMANLTDMLAKFVTANTASTSGSGTLPGNTVTNPREDLKGITTRSGVAYQGPPIPTSSVSEANHYNLEQTSRYSANYTHMTANKIDVMDMACEEILSRSFLVTDTIAVEIPLRIMIQFQFFRYEPTEVELKDCLPISRYAFLEGGQQVARHIAKSWMLKKNRSRIMQKSHKQLFAWKLSDIQGINPEFLNPQDSLWKKTMHQSSNIQKKM
ncbi:reverse transcriptase domain-containing protein [Tanacetum coccineum]|uniref:Reverse transcriptase domain-containing protein n=1 Tax=Tanacetum coccineum TaxID=301880 RepID=A0ABQ5A8R6_9ASTR